MTSRMVAHSGGVGLMFFLAGVPLCAAQTPELLAEEPLVDLMTIGWHHGAQDCEAAREEPEYVEWQQVRYQMSTYIFRQNKCSNYEAPFVYLFVGIERALLIDTGATAQGGESLLRAVRTITDVPVIVAHSHGHGDHRQGDAAFSNAPRVVVAETGPSIVEAFFGFENWPDNPTTLELGDRTIEVLPIPGHANDDLAFYDPISRFVVTGDTLYPGRLYVGDWPQYRSSLARLAGWADSKPVSHVMGTHIEMSKAPNVDYPIGTTHQPNEHRLPLAPSDISRLAEVAAAMDVPERTYLDSFIIWPRQ